jgi:hypothetical protein
VNTWRGLRAERHQQVELQRRQRDLLAVARHAVPGDVDVDLADPQALRLDVVVAAASARAPARRAPWA